MPRSKDQQPSSISRLLSERDRRTRSEAQQGNNDTPGPEAGTAGFGAAVEGLVQGLSEIVEKVVELADKDEAEVEDQNTREFTTENGTLGKATFGYRVRMGLGGAEAGGFGSSENDHTDAVPVAEPPDPLIDIHDEADEIALTAQLPGVRSEDLVVELEGTALLITSLGAQRFAKTVVLPALPDPDSLTVDCENGILDVRMKKARASS